MIEIGGVWFDNREMSALGFRKVYIPQLRTARPWFKPEDIATWKNALRVALLTNRWHGLHREEASKQKENPNGHHRYYCDTPEEATKQLRRAKERIQEFLNKEIKDNGRCDYYKVIDERVISCWDYFGNVATDSEKEIGGSR